MQTHTSLTLKAHISDSTVDFYRDPVDMVLRYGSPKDSNLYGFKICDVPGLLGGAPSYFAQHGTPEHPNDLSTHNGLFYQLHDIMHNVWDFSAQGQTFKIKMKGNRAANDGELVSRWCAAGKGLAVKSCLDVTADLLSGRLISVMPEYIPRATELWIICPSRQSITPAVRLLRDSFRQKCADILTQLVQGGFLSHSQLKK
jgi:DNA-binding transcriptional LysR family regulator